MWRQAKGLEHAAVIGIPFGDPVCPITQRMRRKDEAHGSGAGREHLLPFRNFHMWAGAAHHSDHEGCARETIAFGLTCRDLRPGNLREMRRRSLRRPNTAPHLRTQ